MQRQGGGGIKLLTVMAANQLAPPMASYFVIQLLLMSNKKTVTSKKKQSAFYNCTHILNLFWHPVRDYKMFIFLQRYCKLPKSKILRPVFYF